MFLLAVLLCALDISHGAPSFQSPGLDGRIIGGHNTTINLHPWQLSLQRQKKLFCGAILIAPNWVLTAAHCVNTAEVADLTIRAGSTNHSSGGQLILVSKIVIQEKSLDDDIAILQLASPVTITTARIATLPAAGAAIADGSMVTVTGWGYKGDGTVPDILQEVQVPFITLAQCRSAYGGLTITDNMFCAGVLGIGGKDACQGDSGGPATVDNVVVGIVSWGIGCAEPNYPGVYVKISQYRDWIKQISDV